MATESCGTIGLEVEALLGEAIPVQTLRLAPMPANKGSWKILILGKFARELAPIVRRSGDEITCVCDPKFAVTPSVVRENQSDLIVCFGYLRILRPEVLRVVPAINIHPSLLPFDRGPNPNLWSIVHGGRRGVSIHHVDDGIDTGDLIAQRESATLREAEETLASAFDALVRDAVQLFERTWPRIRSGNSERLPQPAGGTEHSLADQKALGVLYSEAGSNLSVLECRRLVLRVLETEGRRLAERESS